MPKWVCRGICVNDLSQKAHNVPSPGRVWLCYTYPIVNGLPTSNWGKWKQSMSLQIRWHKLHKPALEFTYSLQMCYLYVTVHKMCLYLQLHRVPLYHIRHARYYDTLPHECVDIQVHWGRKRTNRELGLIIESKPLYHIVDLLIAGKIAFGRTIKWFFKRSIITFNVNRYRHLHQIYTSVLWIINQCKIMTK